MALKAGETFFLNHLPSCEYLKTSNEAKNKTRYSAMNPQSVCIEVLAYYRLNIQYKYTGRQTGDIKWAKITWYDTNNSIYKSLFNDSSTTKFMRHFSERLYKMYKSCIPCFTGWGSSPCFISYLWTAYVQEKILQDLKEENNGEKKVNRKRKSHRTYSTVF